jgi:hypothetical protein
MQSRRPEAYQAVQPSRTFSFTTPSHPGLHGLGGFFHLWSPLCRTIPIPKDAIVIEMVERLGADDREAFEERAAIIEYDGQLPRAHAECLALLEVLRRDALAVKGLSRPAG